MHPKSKLSMLAFAERLSQIINTLSKNNMIILKQMYLQKLKNSIQILVGSWVIDQNMQNIVIESILHKDTWCPDQES